MSRRGLVVVLLAIATTIIMGNNDSGVGVACCGIFILLAVVGAIQDNAKKQAQKQVQQQSQGQTVNINISPEMLDNLIEKRKREREE